MDVSLPPLIPRAHDPLGASFVRLPSCRELASKCGWAPERHDARPQRSNLFTAGLIHLPPLKAPTASASPVTSGAGCALREAPSYVDLDLHCPSRRGLPYDATKGSPDQAHLRATQTTQQQQQHWPTVALHEREHERGSSSSFSPSPHGSFSSAAPQSDHAPYTPPYTHAPAYPTAPHMLALAAFDGTPKIKFSHAKAGGRAKKQALSCFFCRERKIACGKPEEGEGGACNQCTRRKIPCNYPTVSHRGQHSRARAGMAARGLLA
ncbi:hypothetical protein B0H15DRAFT_809546 [Mycena belliarum]|uniref:Zn(2)-C6 fungal-type domain-containing protein n=1 Tax=Mycena belliarum TaxID=1033014 RepID=A0AAD6XUY7_9AGAR|nr:hypothetical protein B0H15DRAFT_809546 [Mycena belliae]